MKGLLSTDVNKYSSQDIQRFYDRNLNNVSTSGYGGIPRTYQDSISRILVRTQNKSTNPVLKRVYRITPW